VGGARVLPRTLMERLLVRLERRFGKLAIPNLIGFVVGGMTLVAVLSALKPEFPEHLLLDVHAVRRGEVWRLVTFLFIPPRTEPLWLLVDLYFTWWIGSSLEQAWGAFKFNAFYLVGALLTLGAALVAGPMDNTWLDASMFLAFATVFPDATILLFFIIPVKVKWLGILAAAAAVFFAVAGTWETRAAVAAALANYALFFSDHWGAERKHRALVARQRMQLERMRSGRPMAGAEADERVAVLRERAREPEREADAMPAFGKRVCAICGASEVDGTDIRVCSCDKCGNRPRTLCLAHARAH
jgi:membrane associated rhomboid family serine protease